MSVCRHVSIHLYICTHTYIHIHIHTYIHTTCMYVACMACMFDVSMLVCMSACNGCLTFMLRLLFINACSHSISPLKAPEKTEMLQSLKPLTPKPKNPESPYRNLLNIPENPEPRIPQASDTGTSPRATLRAGGKWSWHVGHALYRQLGNPKPLACNSKP